MTKSNPLIRATRARKRLQLIPNNDGRTQQHFKDETDINNIMAKFAKTGELPAQVSNVQGAYGDFTSVPDYQLHLNQVIAAQEAFDALPSLVRKRFDNDPAHLLAFLQDARNHDEAVALGLVEVTPAPQPEGGEKPPSGAAGGGDQSGAA